MSEGRKRERGCESLSVAIIGGGLGGLAAALALQQLGLRRVVVFERDEYFGDRKQGYGLTLTNNPKGPLAKLGLLEACIKQDCASTCHWVFAPSGHVLGYYGRDFSHSTPPPPSSPSSSLPSSSSSSSSSRGNLRIPRQDLRQLLLDKLQPGTVVWNSKLADYEEDEGGVRLRFEGQEQGTERFDVLVASDGIRSSVRLQRDARMKAPNTMRYVGVAVILGISPAQHPLVHQQGFYVLDGQHRLFTMPFREGQTMWQLSFSGLAESEAASIRAMTPNELLAEALRRTHGWLDPVATLIAETPEREVWGTPLFDRNPMTVAKDKHLFSRVTCLGDACHPMSMFKGQGANQALEDGPLLAFWLAGGPSKAKLRAAEGAAAGAEARTDLPLSRDALLTRLRCFEREMVSRTTIKVRASRQAADMLHSPAALREAFGFEGVSAELAPSFLARLNAEANVGAASASGLVERVKALLNC